MDKIMRFSLNALGAKNPRSDVQNIKPTTLHKPNKSSRISASFASPAPQPGEDFISISPEELPTLNLSSLVGSGDGFTNTVIEWCGRRVILQQFDGARAHERFQEHLAVLGHLRDSFVPITWVAGVSKQGTPEPFILYNASDPIHGLGPLVAKSLLRYSSIMIEKRALDADLVWSKADNINNFYRHLAPEEFKEITASLS